MHADHREAIPILHVKNRAQFLLGLGWGGMSYWVYVTLSCHNWKRNDFHYSGAYLFTSFVYCTNVYWSVIHGIKRKPHLSVVWNWYHFVAIAILHQPRPTDSADINTRLQLSDTSSIPPMHGGFLLICNIGLYWTPISRCEPDSLTAINTYRITTEFARPK